MYKYEQFDNIFPKYKLTLYRQKDGSVISGSIGKYSGNVLLYDIVLDNHNLDLVYPPAHKIFRISKGLGISRFNTYPPKNPRPHSSHLFLKILCPPQMKDKYARLEKKQGDNYFKLNCYKLI
uniref:Uncharacterized protein n=1 Tax=Mimivirus LCMiAC01 TaxID=2506608 RepID=A0A481Z0V6_9VIRU|nr:MAG: hypothetical protein LCMiAC01_01010 [Mimivirus LCMiAC01]